MFLTLYKGNMFVGKTKSLIKQAKKKKAKGYEIMFVKHQVDTRFTGENELVRSHDGDEISSIRMSKLPESFKEKYIFIDEGQFFDNLEEFIMANKNKDIEVYISCLNYDYLGKKFKQIKQIQPYANVIVNLKTKCNFCNNLSKYSKLLSNNGVADDKKDNPILIGGAELFTPACVSCFSANKY